MGSSGSSRFDVFEIYSTYCDIVSSDQQANSKELLRALSKSLEQRMHMKEMIFSDIYKLMTCLDLSVDSRQFRCFYDFVFFICQENGQKNITVNRAVAAWRLVLNGRFRLLDQWCSFLERHQRHNISMDTWQQLLAFSRCVNEDLDGYDPEGAWPVLIDEFVEHMYRCRNGESSNCSSHIICDYGDMEAEPNITSTFSGLNLLPGSKRKCRPAYNEQDMETPKPSIYANCKVECKRSRQNSGNLDSNMCMDLIESASDDHSEMHRHSPLSCPHGSACAVEDNLAKGAEGCLSLSFQFDSKNRVYTVSFQG